MNNIAAFISGNNLPTNTVVPADMVFASASGLDPHISPEAAWLQIARIAAARGMAEARVTSLVEHFVEPPQWGFLGEARCQCPVAQSRVGRVEHENTQRSCPGLPQ